MSKTNVHLIAGRKTAPVSFCMSKIHARVPRYIMLDLFEIAQRQGISPAAMIKNVIQEYARKNAPDRRHGDDRSTTATAGAVRRITITVN